MAALEPDAVASVSAHSCNDELRAVKIANNNLQQCVDKLQNMVRCLSDFLSEYEVWEGNEFSA